MRIIVHCPSCHSRYILNPELRGQRMRCPNPICREVFEIQGEVEREPGDMAPTNQTQLRPGGPAKETRVAGSVEDLVPMLEAESAGEPPPALPAPPPPPLALPSTHVGDVVPLLPAESVDHIQPAPRDAPLPRPSTAKLPKASPDKTRLGARTEVQSSPSAPEESTAPDGPPGAQSANWSEAPPPPRQAGTRVPPGDRKSEVRPRKRAADTMKPPTEAGPTELPPGTWEPPPVRRGTEETPPAPSRRTTRLGTDDQPDDLDTEHAAAKRRRAFRYMLAMGLVVFLAVGGGAAFALIQYLRGESMRFAQARKAYEDGKYETAAQLFGELVKDRPNSERIEEYRFFAELSTVRWKATNPLGPAPEETLDLVVQFLEAHEKSSLFRKYQVDTWQTLGKLTDDLLAAFKTSLSTPANLEKARQTLAKARQAQEMTRRYTPPDNPDDGKRLQNEVAEAAKALARAEKRGETLIQIRKLAERPSAENFRLAEQLAVREGFHADPEVKSALDQFNAAVIALVSYREAGSKLPPRKPVDTEPSLLIVPRTGPSGSVPTGSGIVFALARGILYALRERDGKVEWATRVGIDTSALPVRLPATETAPEIVLVLSSDTSTLTAYTVVGGEQLWQHRLTAPCLGRPLLVGRRAYVPTLDGKVHEIEVIEGNLLGWYELGQPLTVGGARQGESNLLYFPADSRYVFVLDVAQRKCVAILQAGHPSGSLRSEPLIVSWDDFGAARDVPVAWPSYLILNQADGLSANRLRAFALPIESPNAPPLQPEVRVNGWSWFQPYHDGEKIALATDAGLLALFGIKQVRNQDKAIYPMLPNEVFLGSKTHQTGRAQVVHAEEQAFWVLTQGRLQLVYLGIDPKEGLKATPYWPEPPYLGSPLHDSQANAAGDTLFLVTQPLGRQTCLASAVEKRTGRIVWQRQLGLVGHGDPVVVAGKILTIDQEGGLFQFDPEQFKGRIGPEHEWITVERAQLAEPPSEPLTQPPFFFPGPDGKSIITIACTGKGQTLLIRQGEPGQKPDEKRVSLPAPLAGTPALGNNCLLIPLADGSLLRQTLGGAGRADEGPHWRSLRADADSLAHVLHLGGDEFLVTDGSTGLLRLSWPAGRVWEEKKGRQLPARIAAAPLLLAGSAKEKLRLCVADARGTVHLLDGDRFEGSQTWDLGGRITSGPFRRGSHLACIVDRRHLVWLDPAARNPVWRFTAVGDSIVGLPQLVGDVLLVADASGVYLGLDLATGKPRGRGYTLKASVAPAATPVPFGPDRLFAPLTDGTVLLLRIADFGLPIADS